MALIPVILLSLSVLVHLCLSSEQGKHHDSVSIIRPEVLFSHDAVALDGVGNQDKAIVLERELSDGDGRLGCIVELLRGLDKMQNPYVSESVAEVLVKVLEGEYGRLVSAPNTERLDGLLDLTNEPVRFMCDMRLLRNEPVMRQCLLRSFYRIVARVASSEWQERVMVKHLQTVNAKTGAEEMAALKTILSCMIFEAAHSARLLTAFYRGLSVVEFSVLGYCKDVIACLIAGEPGIGHYLELIEVYTELETPLADKVEMLQSVVDWRLALQTYKVQPGSLQLHEIPKYVRFSLPIDSKGPFLKEVFQSFDVGAVASSISALVFEHVWCDKEEPSIDIRLGVKRYVDYLWAREMKVHAQALAIEMCYLYDMNEWEGDAGWRADRGVSLGSDGLTRTDQVTVFHRLPKDILSRIGPVMPVLVSKATYRLVELRASFSNLSYFVSKVLRPSDQDMLTKLLHLRDGWSPKLSRGGTDRVRELVALSKVRWIDHFWRVAEFKRDAWMALAKKDRLGKASLGYGRVPTERVFLLTLSIVFGTAPFGHLKASERSDFLLIVRSQFPRFVSTIQALESLTKSEGDKLSRVNALFGIFRQLGWHEHLLFEWLFTNYLLEAELFDLVGTCDVESEFWRVVLSILRDSSTNPTMVGATKRLVYVIKRGFFNDKVDEAKIREMLMGIGVPRELVKGLLSKSSEHLYKVFPTAVVGAGQPHQNNGSKPSPNRSFDLWANSVYRSAFWFVFLNLSDSDIIGILKSRAKDPFSVSKCVLVRCLSVASRDRVINEIARDPAIYDAEVMGAILDVHPYIYVGWEENSTMLDGIFWAKEQHGGPIGIDEVEMCARVIDGYKGTSRFVKDRLHYSLFANFRPELTNFAQKVYAERSNFDLVLPMLLRGRAIGSIGKSLSLLLNGDVGKIQEVLTQSPLVKQEYLDRIMAAATEFAKGPGRAIDVGGVAQQHRFIENFDLAEAEKSLPLAARTFKDILRSLAARESQGGKKTFGLTVWYRDGAIVARVTVPQDHPPVYLLGQILKVVKEPFELVTGSGKLATAKRLGEVELADNLTVRVLNNAGEIVKQLRVIFGLIKHNTK